MKSVNAFAVGSPQWAGVTEPQNGERLDPYKADVETLVKIAGRKSVWRERWEKGDGVEDPVSLQEWFEKNYLESERREALKEHRYQEAAVDQIVYVRDIVADIVDVDEVQVISVHRSKSLMLPVYKLESRSLGLRLYLRDNFYNWKLSVDSIRPINADFTGLFETSPPAEPDYSGDHLHPVYFEGFPTHLVFGYYGPSDGRRWSAGIVGRHSLWTTLFLMMRSLGVVRRVEANTKIQHQRELDAWTAMRLLQERHPEVERPPVLVTDDFSRFSTEE